MQVNGENYRSIWPDPVDPGVVHIIDQTRLPHEFTTRELRGYKDGIDAIKTMAVRGAPLIGGTAAWSMYLAALAAEKSPVPLDDIQRAAEQLNAARPTAVNLKWATDRMLARLNTTRDPAEFAHVARTEAQAICDEDVAISESIGRNGLEIIRKLSAKKNGAPVNILTHCNAGWLATIDWGTATAPIYKAWREGIPIHVWVDETRPLNQGSRITAWELHRENIPHTLIVDNAGGHLMQSGQVDVCITGTDRTTRTGDVANKIGTYLKALAARDNNIPFYVALPSTTIDWDSRNGLDDIPIEERSEQEVTHIDGLLGSQIVNVQLAESSTPVSNYAFDITPSSLVTGLITERGLCEASESGLAELFPENA
ncbi:MAG: S-methyl-5-thioribose-1-phosphate isomerase [Gammaproteobacteria bacterium]